MSIVVEAQIPKAPTNLQSPNAASLGLYGEVPVSLYTGIPEISIPLFNAPDKYNAFSIGLSYHAGGVRPDQHPGWVGTNWTLMVGGCISRIEKGGCDEIVHDNYIGYYANQNILDDYDLNKNNYLFYDTEPDEFSFNFCNFSGKFYFDRNKKLIVKSNKTLKVTLLPGSFTVPDELKKGKPTSWLYTFKGFCITTEDGTEYFFGGDQSKLEFNMEFWDQLNNQWYATAWHLAQIKYPNGKIINFNYDRGKVISQMYISRSEGDYNLYEIDNIIPIRLEKWKCYQAFSSSIYDMYQGYLISPIYLKSIVANDFSIELKTTESNELRIDNELYNLKAANMIEEIIRIYGHINNWGIGILPYLGVIPRSTNLGADINAGLAWKKLDEIIIYDNNNNIIKRLNFNYNNIPTERLFLNNIICNDGKKYSFEYNDKDKLPSYLADKNDHWGFYNNKLAQYNRDNYYASRESDIESIMYGSLKKITYPTGGTSEFEFDANQYSSQTKLNKWEGLDNFSNNKIAGGLRIRKIINKPINGETTIKEYFYTKDYTNLQPNGLSSGILGGQIQYYFDNRDAVYSYLDITIPTPTIIYKYGRYSYSCFSAQSVLPICTNSMGCHIGYSEVVEKLTTGGYTKYKFSNFDTGNLDEKCIANIQTESPYQPTSSKEQERGNLLSKEVYNSNNYLKLKTINTYKKSDLEYINSIKGNSTFVTCVGGNLSNYYTEATSYKIYMYAMLMDSTVTIYYDDTQTPTLKQVKKYKYNSYNQIIESSIHNSDNKTIEQTTKYPSDYNFSYYLGQPHPLQQMQMRNMINYPVEQKTFVNNKLTNATITTYMSDNTSTITGKILPNATYKLNSNAPMTDFTALSSGNGNTAYTIDSRMSQKMNYSYFQNGNVKEIYSPETGTTITYVWSYNGQYPIAEIKNATYQQVSNAVVYLSYVESLLNPGEAILNSFFSSLRGGLPNALITTYTYKTLIGIATMTDPRGVTTWYDYDDFNRLKQTYIIENGVKKVLQDYQYNYKQ